MTEGFITGIVVTRPGKHLSSSTGVNQAWAAIRAGQHHARQMQGARMAAAENVGGFYDGEEAAACVTLLKNA